MPRPLSDEEAWGAPAPAGPRRALSDEEAWGSPTPARPAAAASDPGLNRSIWQRLQDNVEDGLNRTGVSSIVRAMDKAGIDPLTVMAGEYGMGGAMVGEAQRRAQEEAGAQPGDMAAAERERRQRYDARAQEDPATGFLENAAAFGGQVAGALTSPETYIGWGKNLLTQMGVNAGLNAGVDVGLQGADVATGVQDKYSPEQTAMAAGVGAAAPVVMRAAGEAGGATVRAVGRALSDAEAWGTPRAAAPAPAARAAPAEAPPARPAPAAAAGPITEAQARQIVNDIAPGAVITSGRRTPERNAKVGGAARSYHLSGQALDFVPPKGMTKEAFRQQLVARGIPIAELLDEGDHFHWAWGSGARGEAPAGRVADPVADVGPPPTYADMQARAAERSGGPVDQRAFYEAEGAAAPRAAAEPPARAVDAPPAGPTPVEAPLVRTVDEVEPRVAPEEIPQGRPLAAGEEVSPGAPRGRLEYPETGQGRADVAPQPTIRQQPVAGNAPGGAANPGGAPRSEYGAPPARAETEVAAGAMDMPPARNVAEGGRSPSPRPAEVSDDVTSVGGRVAGDEPVQSAPIVAESRPQSDAPKVVVDLKGNRKPPPREFFRGTTPGDTRRISTGDANWDSNLFVADSERVARLYGESVERVVAKPEARILYEGTAKFSSVAKGLKQNAMSFRDWGSAVSERARAAGYDAVWFKHQENLGTVVLNEGKFVRQAAGEEPPAGVATLREADGPPEVRTTGAVPEAQPTVGARQAADQPPARAEADDDALAQRINDRFKSGPKLYSNPADPEAVKELLVDPATRVVKRELDGIRSDMEQLRRDFDGVKGSITPAKAVDAIGAVGRKVWWTNTAAIRSAAAKYKDVPEIRQLADHIGTDPGRGRVVAQTFERAYEMRAGGMTNRLFNILGDKVKPEFEERIADILSGRKRALAGSREEDAARRVRKLLDEQHTYLKQAGLDVGYVKGRYYPRVIDTDAVLKDPAGFKEKAAELYRGMIGGSEGGAPVPKMTPEEAAQAAEDWYARILGVSDGDFMSGLPSSNHTKGRTLPAEADTILRDFYITDPRANLTAYFRQTSRAAEFARRFGKNGEKAEELFNAMLKKGVDPRDVNSLRAHFDSATGRLYRTRPDKAAAALSWIQTAGVLRLLPRAVISSAAEGLAVGIRAHDVGAGFKAMKDSYAILFGLDDAADVRQAAEMLGIVGDAISDLVISARFGGEVQGQLQAKTLARFFRVTHLHQVTEAQRLAATRIGQGMIRTLLQDVLSANSRKASAGRLLRELGIDDAMAPRVARWLENGKAPLNELTTGKPEAVAYRTALQRFVDESIQNPTAADRPQWANHAFGRLAYGITSFMFSFTRNVLVRSVRETGEGLLGKGYTAADRVRLLTPAIALGILTAAQGQVSELREMVFNPGASDDKTDTQRIVQNLSRAGVFGNADPFINIAMSARYDRDLTSTLTGPSLTAYLDSLSKMTVGLIPKEWGGPNTPRTKNAEWQATKAAYEAIAAPLLATAASYAPGGPLLRLGYGAGLVTATGPGASKGVANTLVGEKDESGRVGYDAGSSSEDDFSSTFGDSSFSMPKIGDEEE